MSSTSVLNLRLAGLAGAALATLLLLPGGSAAAVLVEATTPLAEAGSPVSLGSAPVPGDDGSGADLFVLTEVKGAWLLAAGEPSGVIHLTVADGTRPGDGAILAELEQPFVLPAEASSRLERGGLRLFTVFPAMPPGTRRIEVRVELEGGSLSARAELPVVVPDYGRGGRALLPPFFSGSSADWLTYRQSEGSAADDPPPYPFQRNDGTAFMPWLRPRFPEGAEVAVDLLGFNLPDGELEASGRVLDSAGREIQPAQLRPLGTGGARASARRQIQLALATDGLPPGRYILEVGLRPPGRSAPALRTAAYFDLVERSAEPLEDVDAFLPDGSVEPNVAIEVDPQTVEDYAQALRILVDGDPALAVATVQALEERAAAGRRSRLDRVRATQRQVARELIRSDRAAGLPLLLLHDRVARSYFQQGRAADGAHSRALVIDLAGQWADSADATRRADAAQQLAALGLQEQALQLDPDNRLALRRRARDAEKRGACAEALSPLEHLARLDPDDGETRLRLANCLWRLEEVATAGRILDGLRQARERLEPGLAALVYQQLGEIQRRSGSIGAAVALLREGTEFLPANQRLRIQLARALEQSGDRAGALDLLQTVRLPDRPVAPTPRTWYNDRSQEEEAAREELARVALAQLDRLAAALSRTETRR